MRKHDGLSEAGGPTYALGVATFQKPWLCALISACDCWGQFSKRPSEGGKRAVSRKMRCQTSGRNWPRLGFTHMSAFHAAGRAEFGPIRARRSVDALAQLLECPGCVRVDQPLVGCASAFCVFMPYTWHNQTDRAVYLRIGHIYAWLVGGIGITLVA